MSKPTPKKKRATTGQSMLMCCSVNSATLRFDSDVFADTTLMIESPKTPTPRVIAARAGWYQAELKFSYKGNEYSTSVRQGSDAPNPGGTLPQDPMNPVSIIVNLKKPKRGVKADC